MEMLATHASDWAFALGDAGQAQSWLVAPPRPGGQPNTALHLIIESENGGLIVKEQNVGSRLPGHCPELHIMSDGTFCLGRRAYASDTADEVRAFWPDLGEFCLNIEFAMRRGRWPIGRWISHGAKAADFQDRAESLAEGLGATEEYLECVETNDGWIAAIVNSDGGRIPRGFKCPICADRRQGTTGSSCSHRAAIKNLVRTERARRSAERDYFAALRNGGFRCCGKMPNCELVERAAA